MVSTDSKLQLEINVKVSVDDIWIYMFVMSKLHIEITYLAFQIWSSPFTWKFYPASTMQNPKMMPDRQCCNIFRVRRPIQEISTTLYHRHVEDSNNFFNGLLTRDFESTRIKLLLPTTPKSKNDIPQAAKLVLREADKSFWSSGVFRFPMSGCSKSVNSQTGTQLFCTDLGDKKKEEI